MGANRDLAFDEGAGPIVAQVILRYGFSASGRNDRNLDFGGIRPPFLCAESHGLWEADRYVSLATMQRPSPQASVPKRGAKVETSAADNEANRTSLTLLHYRCQFGAPGYNTIEMQANGIAIQYIAQSLVH